MGTRGIKAIEGGVVDGLTRLSGLIEETRAYWSGQDRGERRGEGEGRTRDRVGGPEISLGGNATGTKRADGR